MIGLAYLFLWLICYGITKWYYDSLYKHRDKDLSIQRVVAPWALFVVAWIIIELAS